MVEGQIVDTQGYSKIIFWQDICNQVNEGSTYFFENLRVKRNNITKQLYVNTAKSGSVITDTEPFTEVLALAPRMSNSSMLLLKV